MRAGYEEEARYFERGVSEAKRDELLDRLHALAQPAFEAQLGIVRHLALALFKQELQLGSSSGEGCSFVERAARWASLGSRVRHFPSLMKTRLVFF